jgi:hypothetical protein
MNKRRIGREDSRSPEKREERVDEMELPLNLSGDREKPTISSVEDMGPDYFQRRISRCAMEKHKVNSNKSLEDSLTMIADLEDVCSDVMIIQDAAAAKIFRVVEEVCVDVRRANVASSEGLLNTQKAQKKG